MYRMVRIPAYFVFLASEVIELIINSWQANQVMEALQRCKIAEKHVCVKWWKLGRWFYGFRMRDEQQTRRISLAELVTEEGEDVLGVLSRGAVHEVLRVQVSSGDLFDCHWSQHST